MKKVTSNESRVTSNMKAALATIRNHSVNIDMMVEAYAWDKPIAECLTEIGKSTKVIQTQLDYLEGLP